MVLSEHGHWMERTMRKIVYRSKAIQGIILLAGICLLLSLWPFRFFHEIVTSSVPAESGTMSGVINDEKMLMQCFVAQYDHMDTIRVYLGEESEGEYFYLRLLDEQWQMVCEEKTLIDHSALPGYQEVMIDVDMEVGTMYYCILQGCDSEIFAALEMTDPSENPYSGLLYYDDSEVAGMGLAADYRYIVPLRKEKVLLFGGIIVVLSAVLFFGAGKLFGKKDKLITAEQAFKAVANPLTAAGTLFCLGAIFLGFFSKHLLDNIFFVISVLLLAGILFYGINHNRSGSEPVLSVEYLKTHAGDLLQSFFLAEAIGACCEYMSGLFDIHHAVAERKEMIFFALAIIAMFRWKEIVNLYNLVYLTVAGICGFWYYQTNLTAEMDELSVRVLKYTVYIAVLTGMILLRSMIALCRKKLAKPNLLYTGLLVIFFAAIIIFRNGRWWTVVMAAGFLLFYLTYGMWEHKERLLTNVCRGIVLQFLLATGYALLHRPYLTFRTARYPHIFHTVTITAAYLTIVECAVLVLLLSKLAGSFKLKAVWKELLLFGVVSSYILFTMARTAFFAVAVTLVFALIFMSKGKGKEKLGNIGRTFGMMAFAVVICFPVTFTAQRTIPALVSDPYMYEIEDFPEDALRGRKLNSVEYMRVGRFIDVFAEKIFSIPEGTFDPYGEIAAYNREHGIETSDASADRQWDHADDTVDRKEENTEDTISRLWAEEKGVRKDKLVASADYVPEAESVSETETQENEDNDYTNGRLDIFRSYIEQLNMTGHEEMGALLEDGSIATHAHNIYLQVAYDHGIPVGILFVLVGIVSFVRACLYYVRRKDEIAYAALPAVITVSVAVAGMVEWIFHLSNPCGFVLMLVIAPLLFERGTKEKSADPARVGEEKRAVM